MKLSECIKVVAFDFDPDATTDTTIGWESIRDFDNVVVQFVRTVGTGAFTLKIQAATDSSGTGATDVVTKTVSAEPDAVGDTLFLECLVNDITKVLADATHVSAVASVATATDEGVINYILGKAQHKVGGLLADIIA